MQNHIRVGINGFGRIGRSLFRLLYQHPNIEITAINDLSDARTLSHLLKYDSVHGQFPFEVSYNKEGILVEGELFPLTSSSKLQDLKWSDFGVDTLVECTGQFKTGEKLKYHLYAGAKKVILSVPPSDDSVKMIVLGVNDHVLEEDDIMISNASCTTNNAAPMLKVIHDAFQVEQAYITTVHSYTSDQSLQDKPHRDLRRARAATQSIIPTTTGAAKALTKIFPDLNNVIGGCGIRVPVPNGSLTDMTLNVKTSTSIEEVNELFKKASENELKGILQYTEIPLVSIDIVGNPYSCVFDAEMTSVIGGNLIKLIGWYDNERGYSSRLVDLILKMN
ncbi:NAD-dependent glyceraldehyde-3-phosphate dehydrogenase [Psychroflexus torquis ATCC 700755]|uniref:NAD-dependent glyceraldehyde-3-phosphate dehydrogenase n=1 Tax=Psychroflexus torquis (strain ATCC 700755 / CIP 106069 / ACAM 623) TaxID=313595 RepID=K4INQ1_PSYTT|nr:type I glyceraldehyde-3-phosphate dehydrogenase [Psychroflexus torquis]AFU67175.1 NAD-dependent glyceraldehyde-3-phosphate dehydrogenase [Psychroflexus torquis ATCC 700755]